MEEGDVEYTIALIASEKTSGGEDNNYNGEICTECFETLRNWLLAPSNAALEKPNKSLSDGLHDMVLSTISAPADQEPVEIKAIEPPRAKDGRGKIEEGELNIVKSRFDIKKANQIVTETKGKCPHHFKSFEDGKIVCGNAPPGLSIPDYKGALVGCGKILTEGEI